MRVSLVRYVEGLPNPEKQLTDKILVALSKVWCCNMVVQLQKLLINQDISLKKVLQMIGMANVFYKTRAGLFGSGPWSIICHWCSPQGIRRRQWEWHRGNSCNQNPNQISLSLTSSHPVHCHRPVLFLIYEKNTRSLLFSGLLVWPPTSKKIIGKFVETVAASIIVSVSYLCSTLILFLAHLRVLQHI